MSDYRIVAYPDASDPARVGTYPPRVSAGGGYVWDEVLEYGVWCSPSKDAADHDGGDCFYAYGTYAEAERAAGELEGAEPPVALVLQREYIDEPDAGDYRHVREERVTEWPVEFLSRPRRNDRTIEDFLSPEAPAHRLAILRGEATPPPA